MVAPLIAEETRLMTLEALMSHENQRLEIIDGELVEMSTAGIAHHIIVSNIYGAINQYLEAHSTLGLLLPDGVTFLMFSDKKRLRDSFVPDLSFILAENFLPMPDLSKPYPGVPDLAVEVVSPDDKPDTVTRKVRTYLDKGTSQIWVIYPEAKEVYQYRSSHPDTAHLYTGAQTIDGSPLLPDLKLPLETVFKLPYWLELQQGGKRDE